MVVEGGFRLFKTELDSDAGYDPVRSLAKHETSPVGKNRSMLHAPSRLKMFAVGSLVKTLTVECNHGRANNFLFGVPVGKRDNMGEKTSAGGYPIYEEGG